MYSTCLFCNQSLGANEVVESFPVGRRLAFDQRLGRLWVVCRKCTKWNLTPLEERWEAIEFCEKLFRDTRKRVSTDQIGLAKLREGLELVRIGDPPRPEFAAWRYGDQFGRRRRRMNLIYGSIMALGVISSGATIYKAAGGVVVGGSALGLFNGLGAWIHLGGESYRRRRVVASVADAEGKRWKVRGGFAASVRLIPTESAQGWGLEVPGEIGALRRRVVLEGSEARWLAGRVVPAITAYGGSPEEIKRAVKLIEGHPDPEAYLRWLARNLRQRRDYMRRKDIVTGKRVAPAHAYDTLQVQGLEACMAVEMAVNEENERRALEGELALLEEAWKEAEEIAAISDKLVLPRGVETRLSEMKRSTENDS